MNNELPKTLIVDDETANLVALRRLLRRLETNIITANSGKEALLLSAGHDFALILLDINMPEMDGYEVARKLKESGAIVRRRSYS